jgi:hypothetical protein
METISLMKLITRLTPPPKIQILKKNSTKEISNLKSLMKSTSDFFFLNTFLHHKNKHKEINFLETRSPEIIIPEP